MITLTLFAAFEGLPQNPAAENRDAERRLGDRRIAGLPATVSSFSPGLGSRLESTIRVEDRNRQMQRFIEFKDIDVRTGSGRCPVVQVLPRVHLTTIAKLEDE